MDESLDAIAAWVADARSPLRKEAQRYAEAFTSKHMTRLKSMGVNAAEAVGLSLIGVAKAERLRRDLWSPAEDGVALLTVAVVEGAAVTDIVAFDPRTPEKWFMRKGQAWALGFDAIEEARGSFDPAARTLDLHETPLDWLRAGMAGTCVVSWTPEARASILDCPKIKVASAAHAQRLRLMLTKPPRLPDISYQGERRRAA
jgi:hypothetical protein